MAYPTNPEKNADNLPDLPKEWQNVLNEMYAKYGNNQTDAQKIHVLSQEIGERNVSTTADWRRTEEQINGLKIRIMELEYLEKVGIYKPQLM